MHNRLNPSRAIDRQKIMPLSRRFRAITASATLVLLTACSSPPTGQTTAIGSPSATVSEETNHGHGDKININNAILSELDKLEAKLGIPALSNQIQASRPYGTTEELVSKKVLTQEQFDRIKDLVTIEDVVLEGEAKDVDYMTKLGLMKGHLIVAKELLASKKPNEAEPHIGHPVEEIYADVEDQLGERGVTDFKGNLISLQDLVKAGAKDSEKVNTEFTSSWKAIDQAIAALPESQRRDPKFILQVINGLLDTANSEYTAAIANGKIGAAIEYQDSRGFVLYAEELYKSIYPEIEKREPATGKEIRTALAELKTAWPAVEPPATPVQTPEQVTERIKAIEKLSKPLTTKS